ncbi:MAG: Na+/H+ antiporter subunit D, partial [Actinomycetota bacterium]|nr:Na+/H+ antiporter subunit D [Actinomycetota bacterium]
MNVLVPLPVVLPLLAGGASITLARWPWLQRVLSVVVLAAVVAASAALLVVVDREGTVAVQLGAWAAPFGISLVADRLSALLLLVSSCVTLAVLVYAVGQGVADARDDSPNRLPVAVFHPVYLVLAAGVSLAFLTGDLFNLFVAFEVMLCASYVLITLGGQAAQVRAGMTYVTVSLLASVLFVTAVGLLYAATGTVNLADLAVRLQDTPPGLRLALGLFLLVVFGVKAAIFPLFFWLPDSYPTAPAPVTAVFAGLLTKVGVYAIIRTQTLLFPDELGGATGPVLLVIAALTMVVGILGAIAQDDIKRILSFTIVSHIGYMVFGLGLYSVAGLTGAVLYTVHHIVVQTTLFLASGLVERRMATGALHELSGLLHTAPVVALLFLLPALNLAGIPPFSGFVAKLALVQAGVADGTGAAYALVAASVVTSLLTLYAMMRIWGGVFWGTPVEPQADPDRADALEVGTARVPRLMTAVTAATVVLGVAGLVAVAGPLYGVASRAADDLVQRTPYTRAVLGDAGAAAGAGPGSGAREPVAT